MIVNCTRFASATRVLPRIVHAADIHLDSQLRGLSRLGEETESRSL